MIQNAAHFSIWFGTAETRSPQKERELRKDDRTPMMLSGTLMHGSVTSVGSGKTKTIRTMITIACPAINAKRLVQTAGMLGRGGGFAMVALIGDGKASGEQSQGIIGNARIAKRRSLGTAKFIPLGRRPNLSPKKLMKVLNPQNGS